MLGEARFRALLVTAVSAVLAGGLALVSLPPGDVPLPDQAARTVTGPGRHAGIGHPVATPPATAVTDLLSRRAQAVRSHDEAAFMATVDPDADPSFLDAQRALFSHVLDVPLGAWEYRIDPTDVVDTASLAGLRGADELWAPRVELRYALAGIDTVPTGRPMGYLFDRRGPRWYLLSDTVLAPLGRDTWRGPWDFGPCRVVSTRSGLVLAHPGAELLARRVAEELDAAVDAVAALWRAQWPRRVAVLLPDNGTEMQALVGPEFSGDAIAAVAIADRVDQSRHSAEGQRVVLNQETVGRLSEPALRVVLRHEITHIAARGVTVDGAPMWLLEGFADYAGYRDSGIPPEQAAPDLTELVRSGQPPAELPGDGDFRAGASQLDLAYQEAWTVVSYLARRIGEPRLVELYRRIAGLTGASRSEVDAALREVAGLDRAELIAGWRAFLRGHLG